MKNRWLVNLGLIVLVAVLLAIAVYRPGAEKKADITTLTDLDPATITSIRLLRANQPEIVLDKTAGNWMLSAPRVARVNTFRINELLRLANAQSEGRFDPPAEELARYGLDKPQVQVWFGTTEVRFGALHPINPQHYVLVNGQVHLIASRYFYSAGAAPADFFSRQLLEETLKPATIIAPGFRLALDAHGAWQLTPASKDIANDRINAFVEEWRHAQALSVSVYSGKTAYEKVRFTFAAGSPLKDLEIGILAHKPELILHRRDEGLQYHFPEELGARLLQLKPE